MSSAQKNTEARNILVVETDADIAASIRMLLGDSGEGHHVTLCSDGQEALDLATSKEADFDLILTDFRLPGLGGLELLKQLHQQAPQRPVVLMSASSNTSLTIEATKSGAYDYLVKPFDAKELLEICERALHASKAMRRRLHLGENSGDGNEPRLLGSCPAMQRVYKEIGRFAPTQVTVLILGETGTGKELIARALYQHSDRSDKPFVAVNCGAIPENLLESELFGHVRGAFTGAVSNREGRFQQADGGTLFLDEIGDLPQPVQVKLLRVLQEGTFQKLGTTTDVKVDVRVLAATHQPLPKLITEAKFREDLFYRISSASIELPPLRERGDDIVKLVHYFAEIASVQNKVPCPEFLAGALKRLLAHSWPGNARELSNVVAQLVVRSQGFPVSPDLVEIALSGLNAESGVISPQEEAGFEFAILSPIRKALKEAKEAGSGSVHHFFRLRTRTTTPQIRSRALRRASRQHRILARYFTSHPPQKALSVWPQRQKLAYFYPISRADLNSSFPRNGKKVSITQESKLLLKEDEIFNSL